MPFIGKQPTAGFASIVKDDLTADGSTTAFTLSKQVANANDIAVFVGNVRQEPTDAYTVNGTTLTMSAAPASAINFYVLHIAGTVESSVIPADDTISTAKIQSSAVTDAKIAGMAASKLTGALPAISGSALTGIDVPTDDYVRITFSGPNVAHNTITYMTPTLQAETGGGFTIQNTNEVLPSVAGNYAVFYQPGGSLSSTGGYTPTSYIYKNTNSWAYQNAIKNYSGGSNLDFPTVLSIVSMNGTSDYFKFALYTNAGNTVSSTYGTAVIFRLG